VVASDKYRLLAVRIPWAEQGPDETRTADLLPDAALVLAELSKGAAVALRLPADETGGVLAASADGRRLLTRLADGGRIRFERFLDAEPPHRFAAPKADLGRLVEQAGRFCPRGLPVRLHLADGVLTASGGTDDEGAFDNTMEVGAEDWPAAGMALAFSPVFLASMLDAVPAETVCVAVGEPGKPARITAADPDAADYWMTGVLMPVRIPGV
jgi:DNA polymerase III sliding clamp (beta) subunit (PCNA family)